jgi:hypothetical protein
VAAVSLGYKGGKRVRRKVIGRTKTEVRTQAPGSAPRLGQRRPVQRDLHGRRRSAGYHRPARRHSGKSPEWPLPLPGWPGGGKHRPMSHSRLSPGWPAS